MKKMNYAELLLEASGFVFNKNENEWKKGHWNVRIIDDKIEIYEDIEKGNRYVCINNDYIILLDILEQI